MKKNEIDKKIRWPKVRDIVYLHIIQWWSDLYICFRLLLITCIIPCNKCSWHWFRYMSILFFVILFRLKNWLPRHTYNEYWIKRLDMIAYAQRKILLEQWIDIERTWEQIAIYIKEEWAIDDNFLTPLLYIKWQNLLNEQLEN